MSLSLRMRPVARMTLAPRFMSTLAARRAPLLASSSPLRVPRQTTFQVAHFATNSPVSIKQQMSGVITKMKTHSGAKKRFSLTGTGLVKFKHVNKYHKMYHKSKSSKMRLLKYGYLKKAQARRVLSMLPYKLGKAKLSQKQSLAKRLDRLQLEMASVRAALKEQHPPEFFTKDTRLQTFELPQPEMELPEKLSYLIEPTGDSFEDPHAMTYAGRQHITLPIRTNPNAIQAMIKRAHESQRIFDQALREPGSRRHRWRPLKTKGVVFPPPLTPVWELTRQSAQRKAFEEAQVQRQSRVQAAVLRRHQTDLLRSKMISQQ